MERRLAAILAADVVGYGRLMGDDETATVDSLTAHREHQCHGGDREPASLTLAAFCIAARRSEPPGESRRA